MQPSVEVPPEYPSSFKGGFIHSSRPQADSANFVDRAASKVLAIMEVKHDDKSPTQGRAQEVETVSPSVEVSSGEKFPPSDVYQESGVHHTV
jgi:hypothetical protein